MFAFIYKNFFLQYEEKLMLKVLDLNQVGLQEFPLETLRKKNANHKLICCYW